MTTGLLDRMRKFGRRNRPRSRGDSRPLPSRSSAPARRWEPPAGFAGWGMSCGPGASAMPGMPLAEEVRLPGATTTGSAVNAPRSRSLSMLGASHRIRSDRPAERELRGNKAGKRAPEMGVYARRKPSRVAASRPARAADQPAAFGFAPGFQVRGAWIRPRDATARRQSRGSANRSGSSFDWSVAVMPISPLGGHRPQVVPLVGLGRLEPTMP